MERKNEIRERRERMRLGSGEKEWGWEAERKNDIRELREKMRLGGGEKA